MVDLQVGKAVSRRYRNRRIGEFLKELDLTEGRSTGIPKMLRVMADNGSPAPVFESDEDRSYYLVRLAVHPQAVGSGTKSAPSRLQAANEEKGAQKNDVSMGLGTKLGPSRDQVKILRKCKEASSLGDFLKVCNRTNRTKFRDQVLNPLLELDLIEMTIPDKPTSSKQKYRITYKGKLFLEER